MMETRQEIAEGNRLSKEYHDRVNAEAYNRKRDMATKYSDDEIRELIKVSWAAIRDEWDENGESANACANIAQAMIAYNNMISERWN
jgi:hypothetical protein